MLGVKESRMMQRFVFISLSNWKNYCHLLGRETLLEKQVSDEGGQSDLRYFFRQPSGDVKLEVRCMVLSI